MATNRFMFEMDDDDRRRLDQIAEAMKMSRRDVLLILVRDYWQKLRLAVRQGHLPAEMAAADALHSALPQA